MTDTTSDAPFVSFAQNWEDVVLWRALGDLRDGTYIDVGAADPVEYSVTKAFYDRGWVGINIEPVGELYEELVAQRPSDVNLQLGAGAARSRGTLHRVVNTGLSTLVSDVAAAIDQSQFEIIEEEIEIVPLAEIISESGFTERAIHFLKIDVEGFEADVLAGIDLRATRPWVIVVEATDPNSTTEAHHRWEAALLEAGYSHTLFDGLNRFYVVNERPDLASKLSYPVCVFDRPFVTAAEVALGNEVAEARKIVNERDGELRVKQDIVEQMAGDLQDKQATIEQMAGDLQDKQAMIVSAVSDLELERHHHAATIAHVAELEADRQALLASSSWRLTGPLRSVATRVRPRRT